jgi:hypothetical protein
MQRLIQLTTLIAVALLLASCKPPSNAGGHPDSLHSKPFWERNEQRDR